MSSAERTPIPARTGFCSDIAPSSQGLEESPIPGRFTGQLSDLLDGLSASTWQRVGYLLDCGGRHDDGIGLLDNRPKQGRMPVVQLGGGPIGVWSNEFKVDDHLVPPLQRQLGKA